MLNKISSLCISASAASSPLQCLLSDTLSKTICKCVLSLKKKNSVRDSVDFNYSLLSQLRDCLRALLEAREISAVTQINFNQYFHDVLVKDEREELQ